MQGSTLRTFVQIKNGKAIVVTYEARLYVMEYKFILFKLKYAESGT